MMIAFPYKAIVLLLKKAGANYTELGVITYCTIPFSFKFLWAPLMDTYFSNR